MLKNMMVIIAAGALGLGSTYSPAAAAEEGFGPSNPFFAPSTLPFHAPPFDKIRDEDYQPAIEAGMAEQKRETEAIAENPSAPTFENTVVALEKTGLLLNRAQRAFNAVTSANTNDVLQKIKTEEAPKLAAHNDSTYLNAKLFKRIESVYKQRATLHLDPESLRLLEVTYRDFVREGATISDTDKTEL